MAGEPYDYFGAMGGAANIGGAPDAVNRAILGQQQVQSNQGVLDQQKRADDARLIQGALVANPNMDDAHFDALTNHLATLDPAAAQAVKIARQEKAAMSSFFANPSARGAIEVSTRFPGVAKPINDAWASMDATQKAATLKTTTDVYGYLNAGKADLAIQTLEAHKMAADRTGEDVSGYDQLIQLIRDNPKGALGFAQLSLAAGMGPDKFDKVYGGLGSERRDTEKQPYIVAQESAKATQEGVKAQYAPQVIESDLATADEQRTRLRNQTANEQADLAIKREAIALDREKLVSTMQLELEKLDATGAQLDGGTKQRRDAAVAESVTSQGLATRMNDLADQIATVAPTAGWKATLYEKGKGFFGDQDAVSGLRATYNQLVNSQAVKNLPPGPASDKDIALAKQGFPPDNAKPAYLASFLRGLAKMQEFSAQSKSNEASWISNAGGLGPLRRDTDIGGVTVPAGTTFLEFTRNQIKRGKQGQPSPGLSALFDKYAK